MVRLEYEVVGYVKINESHMTDYLNTKAEQGWRLKHFSVVYVTGTKVVDYHLVFEVEE